MSRLTAMRIIAWLLVVGGVGFSLFTIVFGIVGPNQEIHAVHNAVVVALISVLTVPPLVVVARRPDDAAPELLILVALVVVGVVAMAISLTPDPFTVPVLVLIVALWFLAPNREGAVPAGRPSLPMLVLGVAILALLVPYVDGNAGLSRTDHTSDHSRFFHWVEVAFFALGIPVLALLGALRPSAYRLATWCAGVGLALLGAASVAFTSLPSALPSPWSWAAVVGGLAFIGLGEWEVRRQLGQAD
jgi:hypothetical protein